ncbi:MAG: DUF4832 domain-containing protein [Roseburia sp.]|nr:DUF4832 domain-containing protein [Roseburia sp.]
MAKKRTSWILLCSGLLLLVVCMSMFGQKETFVYQQSGSVYKNPMMGFAPSADYEEAVGDNTLVYVGLTWRELEPEKGVFAFSEMEKTYNLAKWHKEGKKVVFRFLCDVPEEEAHIDIPDWLYEETGDGTFYDCSYGKGYSPNYENTSFIEYHKKAIMALGEYFGKDHFLCYVQLGSLGHWGEWHVNYEAGIPRFPSEEVCRQYVMAYIEAFTNVKLMMRRPFSFVKEYGMGVFNDMTGDPDDTEEWLGWIYNGGVYASAKKPILLVECEDIWEMEPIGGEFTSSLTMEEMLVTKQERTIELLQSSHMTFTGPKCPIVNKEEVQYKEAVSEILKNIGYRYGVTKSSISYNKIFGTTTVSLELKNYGVAPMYFKWPVCLYVLDESKQVLNRYETEVDLTKLKGGGAVKVRVKIQDECLKESMGIIAIGIENPETGMPEVYLDMDTPNEKKLYLLNVE